MTPVVWGVRCAKPETLNPIPGMQHVIHNQPQSVRSAAHISSDFHGDTSTVSNIQQDYTLILVIVETFIRRTWSYMVQPRLM